MTIEEIYTKFCGKITFNSLSIDFHVWLYFEVGPKWAKFRVNNFLRRNLNFVKIIKIHLKDSFRKLFQQVKKAFSYLDFYVRLSLFFKRKNVIGSKFKTTGSLNKKFSQKRKMRLFRLKIGGNQLNLFVQSC